MCAIAGLISPAGYLDDPKEIYDMADQMYHRGPDAQGFAFVSGGGRIIGRQKGQDVRSAKAALGFDRLSIRDTSMKGMQPMISSDGTTVILFNGEIYNTKELSDCVEEYPFQSSSDTEVVLAYYLKYGIHQCMEALNGMFSICILDTRKNKAFLCRDRVGIKPLYYTVYDNRTIAFASEIKAFLANKVFSPEINLEALKEFFTFGDPVNMLLLKNVEEVTPGTYMTIDLFRMDIQSTEYFNVDRLFHPERMELQEDELADMYMTKLKNVIKRQLASDVSIGVQCSGGVDSSLVAYQVSKIFPGNFKGGVSIICDDQDFSEEKYIERIVKKNRINVFKFRLDDDFFIHNIEKAVYHYESIITYHNFIALLKLAQRTKAQMSVLLSGEGADELFAGYTWFEDGVFAQKVLSMKACLYRSESFESMEKYIRGLKGANTFGDFVISCTDNIEPNVAAAILNPIGYSRDEIYNRRLNFFNSFSGTDFDKHVKYEMNTRLRALLMRQDKACMAYSVENRVPFLDNEMIDLAFSTPMESLICNIPSREDQNDSRVYHSLKGKAPLKRICSKIYGEDFAFRRKMGFPIPFHKYMRNPEFQSYLFESILPGIKKRGIVDADYIEKFISTLGEGRNRWEYAGLWKAITFEVFCRQFIDKSVYREKG